MRLTPCHHYRHPQRRTSWWCCLGTKVETNYRPKFCEPVLAQTARSTNAAEISRFVERNISALPRFRTFAYQSVKVHDCKTSGNVMLVLPQCHQAIWPNHLHLVLAYISTPIHRQALPSLPAIRALSVSKACLPLSLLTEEVNTKMRPDSSSISSRSTSPSPPPQPKKALRTKNHHCTYENCGKSFNRPSRLEEHMFSHTGERAFKCTQGRCQKAYFRQANLDHHVKSAHSDKRNFICPRAGCKWAFTNGTRLRKHIQTHDKDTLRCTGWEGCKVSCTSLEQLARHIDSVHYGLGAFVCNFRDDTTREACGQRYDRAANLKIHQNRAHGDRFRCGECADTIGRTHTLFETYQELQKHITSTHTVWQCPKCPMVLSNKVNLDAHVLSRHTKVALENRKTFRCYECSKGFTKKGGLRTHRLTVHAEQGMFQCGVSDLSKSSKVPEWDGTGACGERFKSKANLENHVQRAHIRPENASSAMSASVGYLTGSSLACTVEGCNLETRNYAELESHAWIVHGIDAFKLAGVLAERNALHGGSFWVGNGEDHEDTDLLRQFQEATGIDDYMYCGTPDPFQWDTTNLHEAM